MSDITTLPLFKDKWMSCKLSVFGLALLLTIPTSQMPPSLQQSLPQLLTVLLHLVAENTHQANANDEEHAHDDQPDDDFEEEDDGGGFDEHEDLKDNVNQAYMQALNKLSSGYIQAAGNADLAKGLIGDNLWVDDEDDDNNAESPIDPINQLVYLMDALKMASTREPESYQHVQSALSVDTLALCQTLFQTAQESRMQQLQQQK